MELIILTEIITQFWVIVLGIISGIIANFIFNEIRKKNKIGYIFPKIESTPLKYNLKDFAFLKKLKKGDKVTVYARTALRWAKERDKIESALTNGVSFDFFLSSSNSIKKTNDRALIKELNFSLNVFRNELKLFKERLKIYVVDEIINNSVAIVSHNNNRKKDYAIMELTQRKDNDKKIVAIVRSTDAVRIIKKQYELMKSYPLRINELMEGYDKVILRHRDFSSEKELNYIINIKNGKEQEIVPTIIQLSLTNECPSSCAMCTHASLAREKNTSDKGKKNIGLVEEDKEELTEEEIKRVILMAKDLETKSIIFSGGEPLMRKEDEVKAFLELAKVSELKVGLMTSGFMKDYNPIHEKFANIIRENCDWVQFSIDSFKPEIYKKIRRREFETCIKSLQELCKIMPSKIEICFTIQRQNIAGLIDQSEIAEFAKLEDRLGCKLKVRLKFAHGNSNSNYLLKENEINKLMKVDSLLPWGKGYFETTMKKVFSIKDISKGLPVESRIKKLAEKKNYCYALYDNLYIDSNGDVYPCCHLFDDNVSDSKYRHSFRIGSVRDYDVGTVPNNYNILKEVWESKRPPDVNAKYKYINLSELREKILPIHSEACGKCTRYINYNMFANSVFDGLIDEDEWLSER